jgi:hypothetical protein
MSDMKPKFDFSTKHLECRTKGFPTREEAQSYFDDNAGWAEKKTVPWKATLIEVFEDGDVWGVHWYWDFVGPERLEPAHD